jgi:hypothetical protein
VGEHGWKSLDGEVKTQKVQICRICSETFLIILDLSRAGNACRFFACPRKSCAVLIDAIEPQENKFGCRHSRHGDLRPINAMRGPSNLARLRVGRKEVPNEESCGFADWNN